MTHAKQRAPAFVYDVACVRADGECRWRECVRNLVTTAGKNDLVAKYFTGTSYNAAWYLGLKSSGMASVSDTLASHAGWNEITTYSGARPLISFGLTSSGSNTAGMLNFSINSIATISGAFIASSSSGTSGILYSVSDFSVLRGVISGDTLYVTPSVSVL